MKWVRRSGFVLAILMLALAVAACGGKTDQGANHGQNNGAEEDAGKQDQKLSGKISIDGSSTVYPISQAIAEEFMKKHSGVNVTVNLSGSSNGFKKLISGEIDIADSSRTIKDAETQELKDKGEEAVEMPVAYDGITVVIHHDNDWAAEMTVAELKKIWEKGSTVKKWSDVRPDWPNENIKLYGPGTASGTFEYFTEAINGEAKSSREDYNPSEDDNVLVTGVAGDKYAMGYFGYSYYAENKNTLKAVKIKTDDGAAAIEASIDTIRDGSYKPLSRPIYIYPKKSILGLTEVKEFIKFYMSAEGQDLVEEVGYVRLPQDQYDGNLKHVE